jgi:hypothetical protein
MRNKDFKSKTGVVACFETTKVNLQLVMLIKRRMDSVPVNSLSLPECGAWIYYEK